MVLCFGKKEVKEPVDEYDPIPFGLSWRMKWAKKEPDPETGHELLRLGGNRVIRTHTMNTEYQALKIVDRHTSVPTYKVITVYNRPEGKLVEYEGPSGGKPLDTVWPNMAAHQKNKIISDMGRYINQLRKIQPPKHCVIGDATLGGATDHRFGKNKIGPFYTVKSFHDFERRGHTVDKFPEKEVKATHAPEKTYELKFTHANLCPENILLDDAGRICAIIGWESAGWYPEYWEYTQLCHNTPKTMLDWLDALTKVIPRYDQEFACEEALRARYTASIYDQPRSVRAPSPSRSELVREQTEIDDKNTESTSG
jgi:aminoglycoside phosphotransferase (APT) family kinase protein